MRKLFGILFTAAVVCGRSRPADITFEKLTSTSERMRLRVCRRQRRRTLDIVRAKTGTRRPMDPPSFPRHAFHEQLHRRLQRPSARRQWRRPHRHCQLLVVLQKDCVVENPGQTRQAMERAPIENISPVEFAFLVDLDNDGKARELLRSSATRRRRSPGTKRRTASS